MDEEIIRLGGISKLLDEVSDRLMKAQTKLGDPAKKRICKYLLNRHEGLLNWMGEE